MLSYKWTTTRSHDSINAAVICVCFVVSFSCLLANVLLKLLRGLVWSQKRVSSIFRIFRASSGRPHWFWVIDELLMSYWWVQWRCQFGVQSWAQMMDLLKARGRSVSSHQPRNTTCQWEVKKSVNDWFKNSALLLFPEKWSDGACLSDLKDPNECWCEQFVYRGALGELQCERRQENTASY